MSVGFKIKKLREEKMISQPELAEILKISQTKLSNIENGKTESIDFILMKKVCDFFDKNLDYFLESNNQYNDIENNHGTVAYSVDKVYNYPENLIEELKDLILGLKTKDNIIENLKKEIEGFKK